MKIYKFNNFVLKFFYEDSAGRTEISASYKPEPEPKPEIFSSQARKPELGSPFSACRTEVRWTGPTLYEEK